MDYRMMGTNYYDPLHLLALKTLIAPALLDPIDQPNKKTNLKLGTN